jgi:YHS domain-containing protein
MTELRLADCINAHCPFSGKLVVADFLTRYRGRVVGFCNPGCRDKFAANPDGFPDAAATFDALA